MHTGDSALHCPALPQPGFPHLRIGLQLRRHRRAVEQLAHRVVLHPRHRKCVHNLQRSYQRSFDVAAHGVAEQGCDRRSSSKARLRQTGCRRPHLDGVAWCTAPLQRGKHALQQRLGHPPLIRGWGVGGRGHAAAEGHGPRHAWRGASCCRLLPPVGTGSGSGGARLRSLPAHPPDSISSMRLST